MTILFFDTETTGIKSWRDPDFKPSLVQLGAILYDTDTKRTIAELNLINRECGAVPHAAADVHGITSALAKECGVPLSAIAQPFEHLVDMADMLCAHNIEYDLDILKDNLPEIYEVAMIKQRYDTMQAARDIVRVPFTDKQLAYFAQKPWKKDGAHKAPHLAEAYRFFFGKDFDNAHDAMADVRACRQIYLAIESPKENL